MDNNPELEKIVTAIQLECHTTVENIIDNTDMPVTVQDATNVFFYKKLAEMQLRIQALEKSVYFKFT